MATTTDQSTNRIVIYHLLMATVFSLLICWGLTYVAAWDERFTDYTYEFNRIFTTEASSNTIDFYQYYAIGFLIATWIISLILCVHNSYRLCCKIDSDY